MSKKKRRHGKIESVSIDKLMPTMRKSFHVSYEMASGTLGGSLRRESLHPSYMMVIRGIDAILEQATKEILDILAVELGEKEYRSYSPYKE